MILGGSEGTDDTTIMVGQYRSYYNRSAMMSSILELRTSWLTRQEGYARAPGNITSSIL